jgi:hypothetical protein
LCLQGEIGEIIPIEECRRSWLYSSIQTASRARAWALVAKRSRLRSSNSTVECQLSMTELSSADPTRPIDWVTPSRPQAARKSPAVYSDPWSLWNTTPATAWGPPRTATVICSAAVDKTASWCSLIATPTIRREAMSSRGV